MSMSQLVKISKERLVRRAIKMGYPNAQKFKHNNLVKNVNRRKIKSNLKR